MRHYVYRVENLINGKFYIGVHSSDNPYTDGYFGSGKLIKKAIIKYGIDNFEKIVLSEHPTRQAAFEEECKLITEKLVEDEMCYNLILGGSGDNFGIKKKYQKRKPMSDETRRKISLAQTGVAKPKLTYEHKQLLSEIKRGKTPVNMMPENKDATIRKMIASKKQNIASGKTVPKHRGRPRTAEDRKKISDALKGNIPWNSGKKMSDEFKEKCKNIPIEKRGKRKELVDKLNQLNMTYESFKEFVIAQYENGLKAHSIHKQLNTEIISVSPIKTIIKEIQNDSH